MKQKIKGIALASIFAIGIITIAVGSFMQSIVVVLSGGNEEIPKRYMISHRCLSRLKLLEIPF